MMEEKRISITELISQMEKLEKVKLSVRFFFTEQHQQAYTIGNWFKEYPYTEMMSDGCTVNDLINQRIKPIIDEGIKFFDKLKKCKVKDEFIYKPKDYSHTLQGHDHIIIDKENGTAKLVSYPKKIYNTTKEDKDES